MQRDGASESIWQHKTADFTTTNKNVNDAEYDVLVVGAGITGISTALLLQNAGKKCIIAEANTVAFGSTGGTTAHLNTFLDTPYSEVIKNFGEDAANLLVKSTKDAIDLIKENITIYKIECSFKERESYNFTVDEKQNDFLDDMVKTGQQLNLPIEYITDTPFPIPYLKMARVKEQAQFNPVQYVMGLAKAFEDAGGVMLQNCRVTDVEDISVPVIKTTVGDLRAKKIIYATHIPPGVNLLHFRCAPYRSYAMAIVLKDGNYPQALGYDMGDPYHYYRSQEIDGQQYLIAGGEDHKTGHEENTEQSFRNLEAYLRQWFDIESIPFKWSSQYYVPVDGLPYIGHLPGSSENIFVATGFNGNGMIFGSVAAMLLCDMIVKGESEYADLFNPDRVKPVAGFSNFVKEAADVIKEFVKGKLPVEKIKEFTDIACGEAKLVSYDGNRIALYKDENHQLHAVNPTCTHIKCTVGWNAVEKSWDCPCHAARYDCDGIVLTGPSQKDLEKVDL